MRSRKTPAVAPQSVLDCRRSASATSLSLTLLGRGVARLELGEEVATLAVERRARVAEPLPERLLRRPVEARAGALRVLPLVEQGPQLLAGGTPLDARRVGRGDLLGLLDDLRCAPRPRPRGPRHARPRPRRGARPRSPRSASRRARSPSRSPTAAGSATSSVSRASVWSISLTDRSVAARRASKSVDLGLQVEEAPHVERERLLAASRRGTGRRRARPRPRGPRRCPRRRRCRTSRRAPPRRRPAAGRRVRHGAAAAAGAASGAPAGAATGRARDGRTADGSAPARASARRRAAASARSAGLGGASARPRRRGVVGGLGGVGVGHAGSSAALVRARRPTASSAVGSSTASAAASSAAPSAAASAAGPRRRASSAPRRPRPRLDLGGGLVGRRVLAGSAASGVPRVRRRRVRVDLVGVTASGAASASSAAAGSSARLGRTESSGTGPDVGV